MRATHLLSHSPTFQMIPSLAKESTSVSAGRFADFGRPNKAYNNRTCPFGKRSVLLGQSFYLRQKPVSC